MNTNSNKAYPDAMMGRSSCKMGKPFKGPLGYETSCDFDPSVLTFPGDKAKCAQHDVYGNCADGVTTQSASSGKCADSCSSYYNAPHGRPCGDDMHQKYGQCCNK